MKRHTLLSLQLQKLEIIKCQRIFFPFAKCTVHPKTLNSVELEIIFSKNGRVIHIQKAVLHGARWNIVCGRDKPPIIDDNSYWTKDYFYLDKTISTCVPYQAITDCIREAVDNTAKSNMTRKMFLNSRFIKSLKSYKSLWIAHVNSGYDTSRKPKNHTSQIRGLQKSWKRKIV